MSWKRAPELPLVPAELMQNWNHLLHFRICFLCFSILHQHIWARRGGETATLEFTRWCFSSGCSKFFQILKIPSFSLLGVVAAALCTPKVLELGSNQCNVSQVLVGMGEMSSPGPKDSPNHRIMEPMRLGKPQYHGVQYLTNHHLFN